MLYIEKVFCSIKIGQSPHCLSKQEQTDFAPRLQAHNLAILGVHLGVVGPSLEIVVKRHSKTFLCVFFQLIRLCGLTWYDFVELVDIERSGGSGVAWLSQTRTNSVTPETSSMARHSEPNFKIILQKLM